MNKYTILEAGESTPLHRLKPSTIFGRPTGRAICEECAHEKVKVPSTETKMADGTTYFNR